MNDEAVAKARSFDPGANGWKEIVHHTAFGDLVGPVWLREENAQPRFAFVVAPKHLNHAGNLHGGMLMTVADQSMGMTARKASGGKRHATIELNIQFVDGVRLGEFVEAHPEVVRATRSLIFMQVRMVVGVRLVVTATGIWKIFDE
jgi:uncharacterized protein (TIGR00369 family)